MIQGAVNDAYEAVISLTVQGPSGQATEVEAVIDTGFTGFLSLPSALVAGALPPPDMLREGEQMSNDLKRAFEFYLANQDAMVERYTRQIHRNQGR